MPNHTAPRPAPVIDPEALATLEAAAYADQPDRNPVIPQAYGFAVDRNDRLDHVLEELSRAVVILGERLEPVLTDASYGRPGELVPSLDNAPVEQDTRSQLAQQFGNLGARADSAADRAAAIRLRVEAITSALEV